MTALIFDTETHKLHGDIIEAAAVGVSFHGQILLPTGYEFKKRFKPSEPISLGAMAVHHIIDEDLVKCPPFTKFKMPKDHRDGDLEYLIGHNIDYDVAAVNRAGTTTSGVKTICTLAMARFLWPKLESHNLTALAYHLSSDRKDQRRRLRKAHSALNDCWTTLVLLIAITREKNINSFEELYEFSEQARYPTHIFYGKYRGWAIKDMEDEDIDWLLGKTDDHYLRISLENELLARSSIDEQNLLPFD